MINGISIKDEGRGQRGVAGNTYEEMICNVFSAVRSWCREHSGASLFTVLRRLLGEGG